MGRPFPYKKVGPVYNKENCFKGENFVESKTFHIEYKKKLSPVTRLILTSFRKKAVYYAIDDVLYLLKDNPTERDNLLEILHSLMIAVQNNQEFDFFNMWIWEIYINEPLKFNKFLNQKSKNLNQLNYITIIFRSSIFFPKKTENPDIYW